MRILPGVTAAVASIALLRFLPYLPGRYDSLAVQLSLVAQVFGVVGLLLVPLGASWLAIAFWRLRPRTHFRFAVAAFAAMGLVWLCVSLAAFVSSILLGVLFLLAGVYITHRTLLRLRALGGESSPRLPVLPVYLAIVPLVVVLLERALVPVAADAGRSRAVRNAGPLIAAIERYQTAHGRYPLSMLAVHMDVSPSVIGIARYWYEPTDDAYNLVFEQPNDALGTQEFVVYNPRDRQVMTSHALDLLDFSGDALARRRGYYAMHETRHPHWKLFLFD
jgi:hypothetical protein